MTDLMNIYKLKYAKNREELLASIEKSSYHLLPIEQQILLIIIGIRENAWITVDSIKSILSAEKINKISTDLKKKLAEVIAVLWCQRESVGTPISKKQISSLDFLLENMFKNSQSCPTSEIKISEYTLANYELSNTDTPKTFVCCFRRFWWSNDPSREHEVGPRVSAALKKCGHKSSLIELTELISIESNALLAKADIFIIDVEQSGFAAAEDELFSRLSDLNIKVIAWIGDCHRWTQDDYSEIKAKVDVVWISGHSKFLCEPDDRKTTDFPIPIGLNLKFGFQLNLHLKRHLKFQGSIERNNLPRLLYWLECLKNGIEVQVSSHLYDNKSALDSYSEYLATLHSSGAVLDVSERITGDRIMTGRPFEVASLGSLLVRDKSPLNSRFFIPNEEFVEIETPKDLINVSRELQTDPSRLMAIARRGHERWKNFYSDNLMVRHFNALLGME